MKKHNNDKKELKSIGIEVKEEILGAFTGIFPAIILAVMSGIAGGLLSEIGKDIWIKLKAYFKKRFLKMDKSKGGNCKVYGVYAISEINKVPVVYYSIPEKDHLELDFDWSELEAADSEIRSLIKAKRLSKKEFLGINLGRLGRGPYFRFFKNLPDEETIINEMTIKDLEKLESWDHELVGIYFEELGMLEEARKHYKLAIKRFPKRTGLYVNLGRTFAKEGDLSSALVHWKKGAKIDGRFDTLYYNIACFYALRNDVEFAIQNLKIAVEKGYHDTEHLMKDPDLASIRNEPRFKAIIKDIKKRKDN